MEKNTMRVEFSALPVNEAFGRMVIGAYLLPLNPTMEVLEDVRTAVSEAVTNAIVHGYRGKEGNVSLSGDIDGNDLTVIVEDHGRGIENVEEAMVPLFSTAPAEEERSGMGFTVMETFMDALNVESKVGIGTKITMRKRISG